MAKTDEMEANMSFSIKQVYYVLISFFGVVLILFFGRTVIVPLAFALLISFILYPVSRFIESKGVARMWSILWTMLSVAILLMGIIFLFSSQIVKIVQEFDDFRNRIHEILATVTTFVNQKIPILPEVKEEDLMQMSKEWFSSKSDGLVKSTLNGTTAFITGLVLTIIYTFLILLYRHGLKCAFVNFAAEDKRESYAHMINDMQRVGQKYLTGMFTLILILGVLNSIGLLALGIDYAIFFGFLAAFLAIIPYVGTMTGGAIPTIYAFMTYDSIWYPLGVILIFWFVQILEGNFLSPKIVGGNLNLNALVAILALIAGGLIWGIPGMILFLPYTAVLKVACEHYKELKPVSYVLRDDLYNNERSGKLKKKVNKIFKK
ncbi:AI-2E family transporter [Fulvivirga ligni]|uniref:AI-2E family transporter n=1 Tax=Fulvivirga ligni TaxID=2904246 RepID=UPI001F40AA77|nr:AI-2E family transporter [Fulvivirga ligni]UII20053.1 AI-2E family transporter [Fulvivirga ligni]